MGLDSYLKANVYVSGYSHSDKVERAKFAQILRASGIPASALEKGTRSLEVSFVAVYWRKANAIHNWFVKNVQDGKDECQTSYVDRDALALLVEQCEEAVEKKDASLVPPTSGFFFGSTEIDEGYWADLVDTATRVKAVLNNKDLLDCEFYYRASW